MARWKLALSLVLGFAGMAAADGKATDGKATEPASRGPAEVGGMAGAAGDYTCTATVTDPTSGTTHQETYALTMKLDLDRSWVTGATTGTGTTVYKSAMFATWDASKKAWYRIHLEDTGASEELWSPPFKNGRFTWEGDGRGRYGVATYKVKITETVRPATSDVQLVNEYSLNRGKTWKRAWERICKKTS